MQIAADDIWPGLGDDRMLSRPMPPPWITAWPAGVDQQDLLATDLKIADLERVLVLESFDENVRQIDDLSVVEHVAEPVRGQSNPSREDAVLGVHDDVDEAFGRRGLHRRPLVGASIAAGPTRSADDADEPVKHLAHAERRVSVRR